MARIIVVFYLLIAGYVNAQQFKPYHYNIINDCTWHDIIRLYSGIANKIVIKQDGQPRTIVVLESKDLAVKRVNDSVFDVRTLVTDTVIKLYVVNELTGQRLDSFVSNVEAMPFRFSINPKRHNLYYTRVIIENMDGLRLVSMSHQCMDYGKGFEIKKYTIFLRRDGMNILHFSFRNRQVISKKIRRKIVEASRTGDGLFAAIVLKTPDGGEITLKDYGLLYIN